MLTEQNIEAELSYAYLHAVASRAGFGCLSAPRHLDDACVDAQVDGNDHLLAPDSLLTAVTLHVQLKATRTVPVEQDGRFSFSLPLRQYNRLRDARVSIPRVLVVLYLPANPHEWLSHSEDMLVSRRCAYWASLRGAEESGNAGSQTVYIPRAQVFSPASLTDIMTRCSRCEEIGYDA